TLGLTLNNTGTVEAATGTLNLDGRNVNAAAYTVSAGATLQFGGNTQVLRAGSSVSGAGNVQFSGGTVTLLGTDDSTGTTTVSGGPANFEVDVTLPSLTLSGGTLGGGGTVTVSGPLSWTGGTMGGTGRTVANGGVTISGTGGKTFVTRTLDNPGTATWSGG